jgi:hypothetical protein
LGKIPPNHSWVGVEKYELYPLGQDSRFAIWPASMVHPTASVGAFFILSIPSDSGSRGRGVRRHNSIRAENNAILSRHSANSEPALDQELFSGARRFS